MKSRRWIFVPAAFFITEIRSPELRVFVSSFSDAEGNLIRHPMSPTWPLEVQNSLTFDEQDGKTTLTMRGGPINASQEERETFDAARGSVRQGFGGTFQQLDEYLAELI